MEPEQSAANKKVKITYEEFARITELIVLTLREFEKESGMESVSQADIVNKLVEKIEVEEGQAGTSLVRAAETSKKI